MLRHLLPFALVAVAFAGTTHAQPRSPQREDLLDAITRHVQICAEITDDAARLTCFDRLQTRLGDVQSPNPQPTPLRPGAQPPGPGTLTTPGGAPATLGGNPQVQAIPPRDPDRAFDPNQSTYRPPDSMGAKPQPAVRRTGPRPVPPASRPMPLVTLDAHSLTYGESRYWQVTIAVTSNTNRVVDTQIQCTFTNSGRPIEEVYFGPIPVQPGENISTELIGPPTTAYVDSTNCRVLSP
jgi:hypothetical protein